MVASRSGSKESGFRAPARNPLPAIPLAILLAACGSAEPKSFSDVTHTLPEGVGSDFQREILADGRVSQSEYERAFDAFVSCAQAEGLIVLGPTPMMNGRYLSYAIRDTAESDSNRQACETTYLSFITDTWAIQQTPIGADAERALREYLECVRDAGIEVSDSATYEEIDTTASEFTEDEAIVFCIEQYSTTTFILPPHS